MSPSTHRRALDLRSFATADLPRAFADAYDRTTVGEQCTLRLSSGVAATTAHDIIEGGGFVEQARRANTRTIERARTLPDRVAPGMRVLVCGLNPSLNAADAGVGFARPGNRFWPAALASGLVSVDRDPRHALDVHRVGMTDLVKRASARAEQIDRTEFIDGAARVTRLCELLAPRILCVVGLTGWRAGVDKKASIGVQRNRIGTTDVYVMPNPSGINAHVTLADLAAQLRMVIDLADTPS